MYARDKTNLQRFITQKHESKFTLFFLFSFNSCFMRWYAKVQYRDLSKPWEPLKLYSIIRTGIMRKLDWLGVSRVHNNRAGNMPVMFCSHQLSYHISPRLDFEFQRQWNFATASFGDWQTCSSTIQRKLVSLKDHGHNPIALSGLVVLLQLGSNAEKGQLNVTWCIEILKQSGFLPL